MVAKLIFIVFLNLNFSEKTHAPFKFANVDPVNIELTSDNFDRELMSKLSDFKKDNKDIVKLKISIPKNTGGWVIYSKPFRIDSQQVGSGISLSEKIDSLPVEILDFKNLINLSISYLGLSELPDLGCLNQLNYLDLSFNNFDLNVAYKNLIALRKLKVLRVYGCEINNDTIEKLKKEIPGLEMFYDLNDLKK